MKKSYLKKIGAIFLVVSTLFSLTACGGNNTAKEAESTTTATTQTTQATETKAPEKAPVTLKILWNTNTLLTGEQKTPVAEEIKKATGVTMDIISDDGTHSKLKLALASNDLPDIVLSNKEFLKQVYDGKLALPLKQLLETKGKDILNNMKTGLDTINYVAGITDGEYYFLPNNVNQTPGNVLQYKPWIGYEMRWDFYEELNYPEMNTEDDFINVLSQMQKNHPKNSEGKKTYGMAAFADWGTWAYYVPYMYSSGYLEVTNGVYDVNNQIKYRYGADGPFWKGVEFLYKARKAGILDPDSFTMKYDNYLDKAKNGQLLSIGFDWISNDANAAIQQKEGAGKGFESVPSKAFNTSWSFSASKSQAGYWGDYSWINAESKNPERAMEFLNYCRSYEGSRLIYSGVKGVNWDIVNGKAELKDETFKQIKEDKDFITNTGIAAADGSGYFQLAGYEPFAIDPNDGGMMNLSKDRKGLLQNITPLDQDFSKHYGGEFPGDVWDKLIKSGEARIPTANNLVTAFSVDTDDSKKINTNIEEYLKKNLAKCILAKSDEDFKLQMKKQIDDLNKLGLESMTPFVQKQIADAQAAYDKIIK